MIPRTLRVSSGTQLIVSVKHFLLLSIFCQSEFFNKNSQNTQECTYVNICGCILILNLYFALSRKNGCIQQRKAFNECFTDYYDWFLYLDPAKI